MKATITVNEQQYVVEISAEQLQQLQCQEPNGYERVNIGTRYYTDETRSIEHYTEDADNIDERLYEAANYYSNETVAEENSRADKLLRQLRRFSVENSKKELCWNNIGTIKYGLVYDYTNNRIRPKSMFWLREFGSIYFESQEIAQQAIQQFKDELLWYFKEYKNSLLGG